MLPRQVLLLNFLSDLPSVTIAFRTGWFVDSALTELAVLFVLRTRRPVWCSRPGRALVATSLAVAVVTASLPFIPWAAEPLGLRPLPAVVLLALLAVTASYVLAAELTKRVFHRAHQASGT